MSNEKIDIYFENISDLDYGHFNNVDREALEMVGRFLTEELYKLEPLAIKCLEWKMSNSQITIKSEQDKDFCLIAKVKYVHLETACIEYEPLYEVVHNPPERKDAALSVSWTSERYPVLPVKPYLAIEFELLNGGLPKLEDYQGKH